ETDRDEDGGLPESQKTEDDEHRADEELQHDDPDASVGQREAQVDRADDGERDGVERDVVGNPRRPGDQGGETAARHASEQGPKQHVTTSCVSGSTATLEGWCRDKSCRGSGATNAS